MKKRIFSLLAAVIFISFLTSVAPSEFLNSACAAEAYAIQGQIEAQGLPKEFANAVANVHYEQCIEEAQSYIGGIERLD